MKAPSLRSLSKTWGRFILFDFMVELNDSKIRKKGVKGKGFGLKEKIIGWDCFCTTSDKLQF
jgi:hypothetical protein